jgi:hypothetical protein
MTAKNKCSFWLVIGALLCAGVQNSSASQTWVALRSGSAMPIYGGITVQTLATTFGTNSATMPFTGTSNYDYYSPPLSNAITLLSSDKGGGMIYMQNNGTTGASDFSVNGRMKYYDYDPKTGINILIADTGVSGTKNVNHSQIVNWGIPNVTLPPSVTIPAGHMVHVALIITLVSGNPGNVGQVIYNGPNQQCTSAFFPQNRSVVLNWGFNPSIVYGAAATILSITHRPGGTMLVSCAGKAATTYSLQGSPTFASPTWTSLATTNSDSNGLFSFVDQHATNCSTCFYRTVSAAP